MAEERIAEFIAAYDEAVEVNGASGREALSHAYAVHNPSSQGRGASIHWNDAGAEEYALRPRGVRASDGEPRRVEAALLRVFNAREDGLLSPPIIARPIVFSLTGFSSSA